MSFQWSNPIPRGNLPIGYEGSRLISPRDPSSGLHDWKRTRANQERADSVTNALAALQRQVSKAVRPQLAFSHLSPFQLYQFPDHLRLFQPDNAAFRWKVRGGFVVSSDGSSIVVPGTDGCVNPQNQTYLFQTNEGPPMDATLISASWHEFVVPQDGTDYYVWLSLCLSTETNTFGVVFGNNNATGLSLQSGNTVNDPWPTFPFNDPYHWLIASLSSDAGGTYENAQFITDNILNDRQNAGIGGIGRVPMNFRGQYDASTYYYSGDTVRVGTIGSGNFLYEYIYWPVAGSTSYPVQNGPIINIDPSTHTPDPWLLFSVGQQP